MTLQQRTELYQRRDALLASLNYATDDEEADELKRQIEAAPRWPITRNWLMRGLNRQPLNGLINSNPLQTVGNISARKGSQL